MADGFNSDFGLSGQLAYGDRHVGHSTLSGLKTAVIEDGQCVAAGSHLPLRHLLVLPFLLKGGL